MNIKSLIVKYKDVIPYLFFGVCTTLINVLSYWLFAHIFEVTTMLSTVCAWFVAVLFAYVTNRKWVFYSENVTGKAIVKEIFSFVLCRLLTGFVDFACMFFLVELLGLNDIAVKLFANIVVIILNYMASKLIIFTVKREHKGSFVNSLKQFIEQEWDLLLIIIIFSGIVLLFINVIPYYGTSFPDEIVHYAANVKFLIAHHRLPISGVDDLRYISAVRDNPFGQVNGIYSYNIYPQLNYIISAIVAVLVNKIAGVPYEIGARYASYLWGIVFLIFTNKVLKKITNKKWISGWLTGVAALIPGVTYISAYVSQDIHSLAISAILVYAIFCIKEKYTKKHIVFLGVACALLLVSKLNYMIYIPFVAGYFLYLYLYKKQYTHKQFWSFVACSMGIGFGISGFWYIRNFILYHDFIGQTFLINKMAEYGSLGTRQDFSWDTFSYLVAHNQLTFLFQSFFMWLLGVGILPDVYYILMELTLVIVLILIVKYLIEEKRIKLWIGFGVFLLFIGASLGLVVFNSLKNDLEFQGRYLYPILVPTLCAMAYYFEKKPKNSLVLVCILGICSMMSFKTVNMVINAYIPYQINTKELGAVHAGRSQVIKDSQTQNLASNIFKQEFVADEDGLKSVSVQIADIIPEEAGNIHGQMIDKDGNIIADITSPLNQFEKDDKFYITLAHPLTASKNQSYTIVLRLENGDSASNVKLYCSMHTVMGNNLFFIDGKQQKFSLSYTSIYSDVKIK